MDNNIKDVKGFLKIKRKTAEYRPVCERIKDYAEVCISCTQDHSMEQASRCMDCATPFCHWACPIGNYIPEWNDLMSRGQWKKAAELLCATNNFPEITGRICPALCEYACTLGINDDPVTIRENELAVIERAFKTGLIAPNPPPQRTDKRVAIIGSGPAGLACADQLNKAGHNVVVFEKDDKPGGILRYGIPDFKLDKRILDRRISLLGKEGIEFKTGITVGAGLVGAQFGHPLGMPLQKEFDAICLAGGSRVPRDLKIDGRDLKGVHFAMDYLIAANKSISAGGGGFKTHSMGARKGRPCVDAKDKRVVVVGGGDTGADCIGVANRQGASCVVQIELLPQPPERRPKEQPWPRYPFILKTSSSHQEGSERKWSILTKRFGGENGCVKKLSCVQVEFSKDDKGCQAAKEIPGSEFEIKADLVILALGFVHPEKQGLLESLGVELDQRGNVKTDENYMTSAKNIFSAGDIRRGQSLIVHAVSEGRRAARCIDESLTGGSCLPIM